MSYCTSTSSREDSKHIQNMDHQTSTHTRGARISAKSFANRRLSWKRGFLPYHHLHFPHLFLHLLLQTQTSSHGLEIWRTITQICPLLLDVSSPRTSRRRQANPARHARLSAFLAAGRQTPRSTWKDTGRPARRVLSEHERRGAAQTSITRRRRPPRRFLEFWPPAGKHPFDSRGCVRLPRASASAAERRRGQLHDVLLPAERVLSIVAAGRQTLARRARTR
ncbi:hypothetical protein C8R46DRAFT_92725 [Mycena filopes]|nr:hypothetical protein C8R46DRAFT_92725 [Mycena filopes]